MGLFDSFTGTKWSRLVDQMESEGESAAVETILTEALSDDVRKKLFKDNPDPLNNNARDTTSDRENAMMDAFSTQSNDLITTMSQFLRGSNERIGSYDDFDKCDYDVVEIQRGLDMYADYTASGSAIETTNSFTVRTQDGKLEKELAELEGRIRLSDSAWDTIRAMVKNGDEFRELIYREDGLSRTQSLPVRSIWRNETKDGRLVPEKAFIQVDDAYREQASFQPWQMVHWRMGPQDQGGYGFKHSILYGGLVLTCNEIVLCEIALTIARLRRAHSKIIHKVDVGTLEGVAANRHLENVKRQFKKKRILDHSGRVQVHDNPVLEEEDIFLAIGKDRSNDIGLLPSDTGLGRINDLQHKFDRLFSGMRASKAWFGLTGPNIKSVVGEQTLSFMRACRRLRTYYERGAGTAYAYGLISYGIDPKYIRDRSLVFTWPVMTHQDDELRLTLQMLKIQVAEKLQTNGWVPPDVILVQILGYSEEQAKEFLKKAKDTAPTAKPEGPGSKKESELSEFQMRQLKDQISRLADEDEQFRTQLTELQELLEYVAESSSSQNSILRMTSLGTFR